MVEYKLWIENTGLAAQISNKNDANFIWHHPKCFSDEIKYMQTVINLANRFEFEEQLLIGILIQMKKHMDSDKPNGS